MPFLEWVGGMLEDSWVRTRLVNSNPKEQGFGKLFRGSYLSSAQEECPGRWGKMLIIRVVEGLTFTVPVALPSVTQGICSGRGLCQFTSAWPHKMSAEQQYHGVV